MDQTQQVYVTATGCEEALLEAQKLKNLVSTSKYACTDDPTSADIIVVYTCGHLQKREDESVIILKELSAQKKKTAKMVIWGCLPMINPNSIKEVTDGCIIGPENWDFFCELFNQPTEKASSLYANEFCSTGKLDYPYFRFRGLNDLLNLYIKASVKSQKNWYIKIISGCRESCTYCSDHVAFKACISEPIDKVLEQFECGLKSGFQNFNLVGRNLGSYGYDLGYDLVLLLNKILSTHSDKEFNLYLDNISPRELVDYYDQLTPSFSTGKIVQIGSHIQSGSNRILRLMGRRYSVEECLMTAMHLKTEFPNIHLKTSVMVGFPTETEEDFQNSLRLLNYSMFDHIDLYMYNERPNIAALKLKGAIPQKTKQQRYDIIREKAFSKGISKNARKLAPSSLIESLILYAGYLME